MSSPALSVTPAMQQYHRMKAEHPDALVFFRMGDFYEMFYEDAVTAAKALEIALTSRSKDKDGTPVPMCGVPYHAADGYIARLVKKGYRVAICEQVEDPKKAKGVVKREVVRVVSPGTLADVNYLEAREPSFLLALAPTSGANQRTRTRVAGNRADQCTAGGADRRAGRRALLLIGHSRTAREKDRAA
jgi:DNA mismatch repair protein MutS